MTRDVVKADYKWTGVASIDLRMLVSAMVQEQSISMRQAYAVLLRADGCSWTAVARVLATVATDDNEGGAGTCSVRTARTHYDRGVQAILRAMEVI